MVTKRPTVVPTTIYTFEDFQTKFGTTEPVFDTDKNGVVNVLDWLAYQKLQK